MPYNIPKGSSSYVLMFLMVQSSDDKSPATGLTNWNGGGSNPICKISKNGASGVSPSGSISETDSTNMPGWYQVAGNATDEGTAGPLAIHASATACDNTDFIVAMIVDPAVVLAGVNVLQLLGTAWLTPVTAGTPDVNVKLINAVSTSPVTTIKAVQGLTTADTVATATAVTTVNGLAANVITASSIAAAALNGKGDWNTTTPPTTAAIATAVWQDATSGDFTAASSIGKSLYTTGNAPGAASGLALVGSNVGTATSVSGAVGSVAGNVGGNVVGSVASVTAAVTVTGDLSATMKASVTTAATAATPTVTISVGTGTGQLSITSGVVSAILTAAGNLAIWDVVTSLITTSGAIGPLIITNLDTNVGSRLATSGYTAPPTATVIADALLDRDMSAGTDSGTNTFRTPRQAFRMMRNKVTADTSPGVVYKENDSDESWTFATTTSAGAPPIVEIDPTGP